jgi:hypothetical protein
MVLEESRTVCSATVLARLARGYYRSRDGMVKCQRGSSGLDPRRLELTDGFSY